DMRMAVYHNMGGQSTKVSSANDSLRSFLNTIKKNTSCLKSSETVALLAMEIGKKLTSLLLRSEDDDINITTNIAELGLDSLVAVELRTWWKLNFGFDISVLEMLGMGTLQALGERAAAGLIELYSE
ncbi:hypothetical protein FQN49_007229, partial [Arthroderma sp. PD_2]